MLPTAVTRHHIRGRIRLRIDRGRRDAELLDRIARGVSGVSGVRRIEVNQPAAGIVIEYDPELYEEFPRTLAALAEQEELFQLEPPKDADPDINRSLTDQALDAVFGRVNRTVQQATGDVVTLKELLPLGIAASALFLVDRAAAAAQWLSWIQFAWDTYWDLHQDEPVKKVGEQVHELRKEIAAVRELLEAKLQ